MKKITLTLFCFGLLLLFAAPGQAQVVSDQGICNSALVGGSLGSATGCGALITVTAVDGNGNAIAFTITVPITPICRMLGTGTPMTAPRTSWLES